MTALAADRGGERLQVEAPADGDDPDRELAVDIGDEGLEDPAGRHAKGLAGLLPVGRVARVVLITVHGVRDAQAGKQVGRPGAAPASHVASLTGRPRD